MKLHTAVSKLFDSFAQECLNQLEELLMDGLYAFCRDEADGSSRCVMALSTPVMMAKRKSVNESLEAEADPRRLSKTRLSLPALSAPRLSLTDTDRLLDATKRSIEIEKLEKYILGKKSVELEIEFGIPRSQLCRWDHF